MQSLIPLSTPHTHTSKAKETSSGPEKQSQKAMRRKRGIYQVEGFFFLPSIAFNEAKLAKNREIINSTAKVPRKNRERGRGKGQDRVGKRSTRKHKRTQGVNENRQGIKCETAQNREIQK